MSVIAIRKATDAESGKVVESNQKAIDALPFDSGTWRVEGVPGLYLRCRAKTKSFFLQRRVNGRTGEGNLGRAADETGAGRGHERLEQDEAEAGWGCCDAGRGARYRTSRTSTFPRRRDTTTATMPIDISRSGPGAACRTSARTAPACGHCNVRSPRNTAWQPAIK